MNDKKYTNQLGNWCQMYQRGEHDTKLLSMFNTFVLI